MIREEEFLGRLCGLFQEDVEGLPQDQKLILIRRLCDEMQHLGGGGLPGCSIVPFITGRRPTDEVAHPGLGSSDSTSLLGYGSEADGNQTYLLYSLARLEEYSLQDAQGLALDLTLSFAGSDGALQTEPIPSWNRRPVPPLILDNGDDGSIELRQIALRDATGNHAAVALDPNREFLPGTSWRWNALDAQIREAATDEQDPFTFGHLFSQRVRATLRLTRDRLPIACSETTIDVCDARRLGSLYQRIVERLVEPDTKRQAQAAGVNALHHSYHPWFPVLHIGADKAALYTEALAEDIIHKKRHLTDPRWLMRVGLYLEFLTCLGIVEAVKQDVGDLLTPAERQAFDQSPVFASLRQRINVKGWREVWALREIAFARFGVPQTGPVSALNLLQKKKATLAFLTVHHDDLKHALELAGSNTHNAQETWHRVFRDAERAVLRKTPEAFPELAFLPDMVKDFVLWHQRDKAVSEGSRFIPAQISRYFGDQDGLYASACHQYRASMNEVALWAKERNLLDYTGPECITEPVSLLWAHMRGQTQQIERLQNRDGYVGSLSSIARLPDQFKVSIDDSDRIYALLVEAPVFKVLTEGERRQLAMTVREIRLGPLERIVVQGREGSSLFLVGEGQLEVFVRQEDGVDQLIDRKGPGDVVGEGSLLTGAPRTATVRAAEGAVVYEIGRRQYEPIIRTRPEVVDELARAMETHLANIAEQRHAYVAGNGVTSMRQRIWHYFLGS